MTLEKLRTVIYDDDEVRLVFRPGRSEALYITFSDATQFSDGTFFYADTVIDALDYTCLGIVAKRANWFPVRNLVAAERQVRTLLATYPKRVLFGSSMGGYGAIKHSALFAANFIIAYCPQWTIDQNESQYHPVGYQEFFRSTMNGMGVKPYDVNGKLSLFFDPYHALDAYHARTIAAIHSTVRLVHMYDTGHHIVPALAGKQITAEIWRCCVSEDYKRLCTITNFARRKFFLRERFLLERLAERKPQLACDLILKRHPPAAGNIVLEPRFLRTLVTRLFSLGTEKRALAISEILAHQIAQPNAAIFKDGVSRVSRGEPWCCTVILTYDQSVLFFDSISSRLMHLAVTTQFVAVPGMQRVILARLTSNLFLCVRIDAFLFCISLSAGGELHLVAPPEIGNNACIIAEFLDQKSFLLHARGQYCCLQSQGETQMVATHPGATGTFVIA